MSEDDALFASYFWWRKFYTAKPCDHDIVCHASSLTKVIWRCRARCDVNTKHSSPTVTCVPPFTTLTPRGRWWSTSTSGGHSRPALLAGGIWEEWRHHKGSNGTELSHYLLKENIKCYKIRNTYISFCSTSWSFECIFYISCLLLLLLNTVRCMEKWGVCFSINVCTIDL